MGQKSRKWQSPIASKGKHLSRCRGHVCNAAARRQGNENGGHGRGSTVRFRSNEKSLHKWHDAWVGQNDLDIPEAEAERDEHHEAKGAVYDNCPHHGAGECDRGVLDFFRHLHESEPFRQEKA